MFTGSHLYPLIHGVANTQAVGSCGETDWRPHLGHGGIGAIALRNREMNDRPFEGQTPAGRHLPDTVQAFVHHLRDVLANEL